jgi:hypothetical protein
MSHVTTFPVPTAVFMDINISEMPAAGRLKKENFSDIVPKSAAARSYTAVCK